MNFIRTSRKRGFTLPEMLITLLIVGILAGIAIVSYSSLVGNSKTTSAKTSAEALGRNIQGLSISATTQATTRAIACGTQTTTSCASGTAVATAIGELPSSATASVFTSFSTAGKITVTASGTSVCLTIPADPTSSPGSVSTTGACS